MIAVGTATVYFTLHIRYFCMSLCIYHDWFVKNVILSEKKIACPWSLWILNQVSDVHWYNVNVPQVFNTHNEITAQNKNWTCKFATTVIQFHYKWLNKEVLCNTCKGCKVSLDCIFNAKCGQKKKLNEIHSQNSSSVLLKRAQPTIIHN